MSTEEIPLLGRKRRSKCRVCMLMITHECNLNCSYCYEKYKSNLTMSLEMAKSIILKEIELVKRSAIFERLEIDFMGGEPFLNFQLIQQIVEWIECLNVGVPIAAFCSTNGTLVTPEKYEWLRTHRKNFSCGLSYDGNKCMQGKNRTNQYVDIEFFLKTWPEQWVRITISKETLPYLTKGVLWLQHQKAHVQMTLAQGIQWTSEDAISFKQQLKKLSHIYLNDPTIEPVEFLTRPLLNIGKRCKNPVKLCGAGNGMSTYDVDGKCYPCHMFSPIVLGNNALQLNDAKFCSDNKSIDSKCKRCIYMNWCSNCYGFNFLYRNNPLIRDCSICKMTDIHARACCEFQLNFYHKNKSKIKEIDGVQIRAALDAYALMVNHVEDWNECC